MQVRLYSLEGDTATVVANSNSGKVYVKQGHDVVALDEQQMDQLEAFIKVRRQHIVREQMDQNITDYQDGTKPYG